MYTDQIKYLCVIICVIIMKKTETEMLPTYN